MMNTTPTIPISMDMDPPSPTKSSPTRTHGFFSHARYFVITGGTYTMTEVTHFKDL